MAAVAAIKDQNAQFDYGPPSHIRAAEKQPRSASNYYEGMDAAPPGATPPVETPGFFMRLGQSLGIPTTPEEAKAATSIPNIIIGASPALSAVRMAANYLKTSAAGIKEGIQEAGEAGANIAQGGPIGANVGKAIYGATHARLQSIPWFGPSIETAGQDISQKNYAGAAGGLTGITAQLAAPNILRGGSNIVGAGRKFLGLPATSHEAFINAVDVPKGKTLNAQKSWRLAFPDILKAETEAQAIDPNAKVVDVGTAQAATRQALNSAWSEYGNLFPPDQQPTINNPRLVKSLIEASPDEMRKGDPRTFNAIRKDAEQFAYEPMTLGQTERILEFKNKAADPETGNAAEYTAKALRQEINRGLAESSGNETGDIYQLKRRIGSLLEVQDALARTAGKQAKESPGIVGRGLSPYIAGRTLIDLARGIHGDPSALWSAGRGVAELGAISLTKRAKSPDYLIGRAFDLARKEGIQTPQALERQPQRFHPSNLQTPADALSQIAVQPAGKDWSKVPPIKMRESTQAEPAAPVEETAMTAPPPELSRFAKESQETALLDNIIRSVSKGEAAKYGDREKAVIKQRTGLDPDDPKTSLADVIEALKAQRDALKLTSGRTDIGRPWETAYRPKKQTAPKVELAGKYTKP